MIGVINLKFLSTPQHKPIDKDSVIEDLKRKLLATEYQLELYKTLYAESEKSAFKYWSELNDSKNQ
jgi:hypothetical protein